MDVRRLVGRNLKRFRAAANITQERLAERTGVPQQHISEIERGHGNPTVVTLSILADALGVSAVALLEPDEAANEV